MIVDTHTHLYSEAFDIDRDEMMSRALKAGVSRFFVPAIDSTYTEAMYALERKYPEHVFLMMGVHPTHIKHLLVPIQFVKLILFFVLHHPTKFPTL